MQRRATPSAAALLVLALPLFAPITLAPIAFAAFAVAAIAFTPVAAWAADVPATLTGTSLATADDVTKLAAAKAVLVDARVASEYADGHIKGAISIPYREKSDKSVTFDASADEFNLAKLPADKATAIVNGTATVPTAEKLQGVDGGGQGRRHQHILVSRGLPRLEGEGTAD